MNKLYSVHDHWTDIAKKNNVDIESIDGVIAGIKVNGEDYGGGGSSDLSIVFLTISSQKNVYFALKNCIQVKGQVGERYIVADDNYAIAPQDGTRVLNIPLIDGHWECEYEIGAGGTLNVVGNGEANDDLISITGDCTITIS